MPNLFVIAGPNGAGKSTSAPKLLTGSRHVAAFVNADDIAVSDNVGEMGQMADNSWPDMQRPIASRDAGGPMRIENSELWRRLLRGALKPIQKSEQELLRVPLPEFKAEEVFEAIHLAAREAIARHKALGQSIVIWRDGKVVVVPPEEIEL